MSNTDYLAVGVYVALRSTGRKRRRPVALTVGTCPKGGQHPTEVTYRGGRQLEPLHVEGEPLGLLRPEQRARGGARAVVRSRPRRRLGVRRDQHMKNHVWRELWPAMPADARQYWHWVTRRVMGVFEGGGGGMRQEAEKAGREAGRAAAQASVARGEGVEQQQAASAKASADMTRQVEAKLRAGTTRPCTKQHLFQAGEYLLQDAHLSEPFEVNVAFTMSAYVCLARQTGCRPGMTMNDANDLANTTSHWCAPTASGTRRHGGVEGARGPAGWAPVHGIWRVSHAERRAEREEAGEEDSEEDETPVVIPSSCQL
mmetsp:Transcript_16163/g.52983  ORF Transcript_16163/g.52983 Transcript_16163/m.52983 type:complete len:314 (+) Transcript_16163:571-1512(+)